MSFRLVGFVKGVRFLEFGLVVFETLLLLVAKHDEFLGGACGGLLFEIVIYARILTRGHVVAGREVVVIWESG